MKCNVKCYYKTGFNFSNIPDSPDLLETVTDVKTFDSVYVKQNRNLINLKIASTYDNIKDADYLSLNDNIEIVYYFIAGINMINDNVANLTLFEDTLTTIGGPSSLDILDGWCTRKHVTTDNLFEHNVPEDFQPALPFKVDNYKMLSDYNYSDNINLVLSTVDLTSNDLLKAEVFVGNAEEEDFNVTVPGLPTLSTESVIGIRLYNGETPVVKETKYPNIGIFDFNDSIVKESIRILRSLGLESVIVGCYKIPPIYIYDLIRDGEIGTQTNGKITRLISKYIDDVMTRIGDNELLSFEYGTYVPSNKKVFSQFNNITIFSPTSGDSNNFEFKDIYSDNAIPDFILTPDVSCEGTPVCRPAVINSQICNQYNWFLDATRGSNWINTPITMREASGNAINAANYSIIKGNTKANLDRYTYQMGNHSGAFKQLGESLNNVFSGVVSAGTTGNPAGMINAVGQVNSWEPKETVRTFQDLARDEQSKILSYETEQNIVAPQISFPQNVSLQLYYGNIFCSTTFRLQDADLERFDRYLTRYGYKVSEILTQDCFKGRKNFNFVKASGILIGNEVNLRRKNNVEQIFNNGVRVWHKLPTLNLLQSNPIVVSK